MHSYNWCLFRIYKCITITRPIFSTRSWWVVWLSPFRYGWQVAYFLWDWHSAWMLQFWWEN